MTFQAGDELTRCKHTQLTSWNIAPSRRLTQVNVFTFIALFTITVSAVFLIWPQEIGPELLQNAHVPFLYEARKQNHALLLIFASQAFLMVILSTRPPNSPLAVWAMIGAATLPFAAELGRLEHNNPTQNLVVIFSCIPIIIRMLGHVHAGRSLIGTVFMMSFYSALAILFVTVVANTRMGPLLAFVFGENMVLGVLLIVLVGATVILFGTLLTLGGVARVMMDEQNNRPFG